MKGEKLKVITLVCIFLGISYFCFAQGDEKTAQKLDRFHAVQYEDAGEKKWELNGASAEVFETSIEIDQLSALAFAENGCIKLKAEKAHFDREKQLVQLQDNVIAKTTGGILLNTDSLYWDAEGKNIFTEDNVDIKRMDFKANGQGATCSLEDKTARLKNDITANIKSSDVDFLQDAHGGQQTTITCDGPFQLDYKKHRATFYNNVKVRDLQGNVFSDRLDIYFNQATRRPRRIVARGNVRIVNEGSVTYSDKAIYLVEQGRLILPKRPKLLIKNEEPKKQ